jgi:aspartate/methionine/tyrosine aminotransferase
LTFVLGGLSKSAGLPQVKLGWMVVSGPEASRREAIERLAVICDTYLSVSTPVQVAASALLERGRVIRRAIHDRTVANLACLERVIGRSSSVSLLLPEGGWSAVMRVPALETEEALVLRLLSETHVIVHPGFFFDFQAEAFLVVSLLPEISIFEDGMTRVLKAVTDRAL